MKKFVIGVILFIVVAVPTTACDCSPDPAKNPCQVAQVNPIQAVEELWKSITF